MGKKVERQSHLKKPINIKKTIEMGKKVKHQSHLKKPINVNRAIEMVKKVKHQSHLKKPINVNRPIEMGKKVKHQSHLKKPINIKKTIEMGKKVEHQSHLKNMKKTIDRKNRKTFDPQHLRTLFFRFSENIDKARVKSLHPGIECVRFRNHRIKRWCHVRFVSEKIAKRALRELHNKETECGKLIVTETKKARINHPNAKTPKLYKLYVSNLPEKVTKKEIFSAFPGAKKVRILPQKGGKESIKALVGFRTLDEMKEVISNTKMHNVQGRNVSVSYSKTFLNSCSDTKNVLQSSSTGLKSLKNTPEDFVADVNDVDSNDDDSDYDDDDDNNGDDYKKNSIALGKKIESSILSVLHQNRSDDINNSEGEEDDSEDMGDQYEHDSNDTEEDTDEEVDDDDDGNDDDSDDGIDGDESDDNGGGDDSDGGGDCIVDDSDGASNDGGSDNDNVDDSDGVIDSYDNSEEEEKQE